MQPVPQATRDGRAVGTQRGPLYPFAGLVCSRPSRAHPTRSYFARDGSPGLASVLRDASRLWLWTSRIGVSSCLPVGCPPGARTAGKAVGRQAFTQGPRDIRTTAVRAFHRAACSNRTLWFPVPEVPVRIRCLYAGRYTILRQRPLRMALRKTVSLRVLCEGTSGTLHWAQRYGKNMSSRVSPHS